MVDNKKQWFLLILAAAWLLIALALTIGVYYVTQDVRTLGLATRTTPPIAMLQQLYHYHFPPSVADYELKRLKIQAATQRKRQGKP